MKRVIAVIVLVALFACGGVAYAAVGGGAGDPLISLSYLKDTFIANLLVKYQAETDSKLENIFEDNEKRLAYIEPEDPSGSLYAGSYTALEFSTGGWVELSQFASFVPSWGTFMATVEKGSLIDITTADEYFDTCVLTAGKRYFAAEGSEIQITSYSDGVGLVDGYYNHASTGTIPSGTYFVDIENHWSKSSVLYMAQHGYVNGIDSLHFAPDDKVTRAMFVTVLGRVAGVNTASYGSSQFVDVNISDWYGPYVAWAASVGVVTGYDSQHFAPNDYITREQMAVILVRFMNAMNINVSPTNAPITFTDSAAIDSWATDAVAKTQTMGIINGIADGSGYAFKPLDTAVRGQMCAVIERMLTLSGRG